MSSPTVSVILPTLNRAAALQRSARSVLDQSFHDLELIIVDDGSVDDIKAVADALNDERVVYVRREQNGGASAARNTGIALARGRYIAFQDSDDLWLPGKLEHQVGLFDTLPEKVGAITGFKILYGRNDRWEYGEGLVTCTPPLAGRLRLDENQRAKLLTSNRLNEQNALFKRDCMNGEQWFDPCAKANVGWEFATRLAKHSLIYEDVEPVVIAFISGDSISTNPKKKAIGIIRRLKNNSEIFSQHATALATNYVSLAAQLATAGHSVHAQRFLMAALVLRPTILPRALGSLRKILLGRVRGGLRQFQALTVGRTARSSEQTNLRHWGGRKVLPSAQHTGLDGLKRTPPAG